MKAVSLVVVEDGLGHCLLVRSARRPARWELPGGAVEPEESPMAGAVREVMEETGVVLGQLRLVGLYYGTRDHLLRITFAGRPESGEYLPQISGRTGAERLEILELKWFDAQDLPLPMPVIARQMIADSRRAVPAVLATVPDDSELISSP